jgi:hypothetical protein
MAINTDHFAGETWRGVGARIWRQKPDLRVHFAISRGNAGVIRARLEIQYRRVTTRTGELDGATDTDGG